MENGKNLVRKPFRKIYISGFLKMKYSNSKLALDAFADSSVA